VASAGGHSTQFGALLLADVAAPLPAPAEPVLAALAAAADEVAATPPPIAVPVHDDVQDVTAAVIGVMIGVVPVAAVVVVPVALAGAVAADGRLAAPAPEG
jgi:hypothetical protein